MEDNNPVQNEVTKQLRRKANFYFFSKVQLSSYRSRNTPPRRVFIRFVFSYGPLEAGEKQPVGAFCRIGYSGKKFQ